MRYIVRNAGRRPKALGNRRSGRAGEPAAGDSVRASESLDDVPQDPRLFSYPPIGPTDRPPDLYGSLSRTFGIVPRTVDISRSRGPGSRAGRARAGPNGHRSGPAWKPRSPWLSGRLRGPRAGRLGGRAADLRPRPEGRGLPGFPAARPGARADRRPAGSVVNLIAGPARRAHSRPADHFFI